MRIGLAGLICLGLVACEPIPNSAGPDFLGSDARNARNQELQGAEAGAPLDAMRPAPEGESPRTGLANDQVYVPENSPVTTPLDPIENSAQPQSLDTMVPINPSMGEEVSEAVDAAENPSSGPVGTRQYDRNFASETRSQLACGRYASAEEAQQAFVAAGGPEQDGQGLDPDGDGYACGWQP
jgi:hypothetical protein